MNHSRVPTRVARYSVAAVLVLCSGGLIAACEHSDAVLNAKFGAGITAPRYLLTGLDPSVALRATEVVLTSAPVAEPVSDEANRGICGDTPVRDLYATPPADFQESQRLLFQMTIDQKVKQLIGIPAPDYSDSSRFQDIQRSQDDKELDIPGYQWRDGPHGLNLEAGVGRNNLSDHSTSFPTSVVQGATWDVDLAYRVGEAMGDETVAAGNNVLLAPCMNALRNPLWGRAQETFGEDNFHLGRIASEVTRGLQSYVTGCAKHWLANNIEINRFSINATMDEQTLRETYGRHFEMVVRDGGIGCVMASYNSVNGKKQTQNKHTLTEVLRYDYGFRGMIISDWWAMPGPHNGQGPVDAPQDLVTSAEAIEAGLDIELPWAVNFKALPSLVASGTIAQSTVDGAVLRVLQQKLRFKSAHLNQPYYGLRQPVSTYDGGSITGQAAVDHALLAREAAEKGAVLLKNDPLKTDPTKMTLPIAGVSKIAVIGATVAYKVRSDNPSNKKFDFVSEAALGDRGSSRVRPDPALTIGPLKGITDLAATKGIAVTSGASAADVGDADLAVVIVGLTPGNEGEEYTGAGDRQTLSLPAPHDDLVNSVIALGKRVVVIVEAGAAVDLPWRDKVGAIVMAWYPGQQGGAALARLLFGDTNFAGRLPVTWPQSLSQFPTFSDGPTTHMDYYLGYHWFDKNNFTPLYAFGHGLSYSTFKYERVHVPCGSVSEDGLVQVEVDVRNVAGPEGDEVVQIYASYPNTTARRNAKELKGFARIHLLPGQAKRVSIPLRIRDLKYWDMNTNAWVVEKGPVLIQVGPSSDKLDPRLAQTLTVN